MTKSALSPNTEEALLRTISNSERALLEHILNYLILNDSVTKRILIFRHCTTLGIEHEECLKLLSHLINLRYIEYCVNPVLTDVGGYVYTEAGAEKLRKKDSI